MPGPKPPPLWKPPPCQPAPPPEKCAAPRMPPGRASAGAAAASVAARQIAPKTLNFVIVIPPSVNMERKRDVHPIVPDIPEVTKSSSRCEGRRTASFSRKVYWGHQDTGTMLRLIQPRFVARKIDSMKRLHGHQNQ